MPFDDVLGSVSVAVCLDGAGAHPAAWRDPGAQPERLWQAGYWIDLVQEAERGLLDFVTLDDGLAMQSTDPNSPDDRIDRVRGRLDAVLVASRVAPHTRAIGLVPSVTATHTEPFHLSKAIATLDFISGGRAGVSVRTSDRTDETALFGRRPVAPPLDLLGELAEYVEVVRRLWDSWEDEAEIRDVATGRFVDRAKLHHIDFHGRWFDVKGPSITPRPPQGLPPVALTHSPAAGEVLVRNSDLVLLGPCDLDVARDRLAALRLASADLCRVEPLPVFADLTVLLGATDAEAIARRDLLDGSVGPGGGPAGPVFAGTPSALADLVEDLAGHGLRGVQLRPGVLPRDLLGITGGLVPELQRRGLFRTEYAGSTLRARLGLARPASRYRPEPEEVRR